METVRFQLPKTAESGRCGWFQWAKDRVKLNACRLAHWLGMPGIVRDWEEDDLVTGLRLSIKVTRHHTQINIGNRDITFDRLTGKWIGAGYLNPECRSAPEMTLSTGASDE